MKFYTFDWWCGLHNDDYYDPGQEFKKHLSSIRDRLPAGLLALQESISLHDARLRLIDYHCQAGGLTLHFDGADGCGVLRPDGDDGKGGLLRFTLRYLDVVSFKSLADPKVGLPGPHGFGDMGYDEADIDSDGNFEHRLLYSSGIEMQIVFRGFELNWEDAK